MKRNINHIYAMFRFCSVMIGTLSIASCSDFIDVGPPKSEITTSTVFTNDASATSTITGIYSLMMTNQCFMKGDLERYTGLSSDELDNFSANSDQIQFAQSQLINTNTITYGSFWQQAYIFINNANAALEGLESSSGLSPQVRDQLKGEALFIRAFCHLYLVALFGDIPYVTSTDYTINSKLSRTPASMVYSLISADLETAKLLLSEEYVDTERIRPNRSAAAALLARVYLYTSAWDKAEAQASEVISNAGLYELEPDLANVFLANNNEAIWQLKPVSAGTNAAQGQVFILTIDPGQSLGGVALTQSLLASFEANDKRAEEWIGSYSSETNSYLFPYKYKQSYSNIVTEYSTLLRLGEQYLIRAEARCRQNKTDLAKADLNTIRQRAGLPDITDSDNNVVIEAIAHERVTELFTENGHRWMDLKRTGKADAVMSSIRANWKTTDQLYPIPNAEILLNVGLSQNPGY